MEYKTVQGEVTDVQEDAGIITALFAIFGNIDHGGDRIFPGAFSKTIMERGRKILILDQHRADSIGNTIAKPISLREVSRDELPPILLAEYPEASGGAEVVAEFDLEDETSRKCFRRIKNKWVSEWSFGYDTLDSDFTKEKVNGKEITVRNLRTLKLYEVSSVLWGMNSGTVTTGAKAKEQKPYTIEDEDGQYVVYREDEDGNSTGDALGSHDTREEAEEQIQAILISESEKGVSGKADLPLTSREREWDNTAAEARVREWAGGEDIDWTKYKEAHFWFDNDNSEEFGGYKLQFADIVGGELQAVPRAVFAVAGALQGARQGLDIPDGDQDKIKTKVSGYYANMRTEFSDDTIIPPWDKQFTWETLQAKMASYYKENEIVDPTDEQVGLALVYAVDETMKEYTPMGPVQRLGEVLQGIIHKSFTTAADTFYIEGMLSTEERIALSSAIGDALEVFRAGIPLGVEERQVYYYPYCALPVETEEKAGRVLSRRNANRVTSAVVSLIEALDDAGIELDGFARVVEEEGEKTRAEPVSPLTLLEIEQELLLLAEEM